MATMAKATEKKPHLFREAEFKGARETDQVCSRCGVMSWQEVAGLPCPGKPAERDAFKELPRTTRPRRSSVR